MPEWITHLSVAKKVAEKIEIEDKNSFYIGNLIPDAERHVVKDFSIFVPYEISHFSYIKSINGKNVVLPHIEKFLNSYKNKMKNPMVLGYFVHLLTDYYWNSITNARFLVETAGESDVILRLNDGTKMECNKQEKSAVKHADFRIFKNQILKSGDYEIPKYEDKLLEDLKDIEEVPFTEEDIKKIINYVEKEHYVSEEELGEYRLFTKEQIMEDYEDCINYIIEEVKKKQGF